MIFFCLLAGDWCRMSKTASDVLIDTLIGWGIDTIFGLPGDGINGVIEALRQRQDKVRFIQVRHEESAAFMACAYAKYTGKLGCCLATSGPGAIHLLNGLYDAKMDQAPVLALTGQTFSDLKGSNFQQEVNLTLLFEDVTVYNQEVINPDQVEMLANEACRHALDQRGVAHITFPIDYQIKKATQKHTMHKAPGHTTNFWVQPRLVPDAESLQQAAELINAAQRPALLVGQGALHARDEVIELAEKIGAPIIKALLGKGVVADDHTLTTGGLGLLGTTPSQNAIEECDLLLMIGSSFPYMEYLPKHGQAKAVQVDDKPNRIGLRFPVDVGLIGDSKSTLKSLMPLVLRKEDRSFLEKRQSEMSDWWKLMETRATAQANKNVNSGLLKPQAVAWALTDLVEDTAIISGDSGTNTSWIAQYFKLRGQQKFSCSGNLATMAPGLPYAIAAKVAFPERQSIAFVGDGAFTMLMGDFATAVKYNLPIMVIVVKNNVLGQIKWEQIVFLGNPEYGVELHDIDFAKFADACGGVGYRVEKYDEIKPTFERAIASGKPCLIEAIVDPFEPPLPPKVEPKQAIKFAEALAKGQPARGAIALTLFRDKVSELFPRTTT